MLLPSDENGALLKPEERPALVALERRMPGHRRILIRSGDRPKREIELTAVPLIATGDEETGERFLGALSIFWDPSERIDTAIPADPAAGTSVEMVLTQRLASTLAMPIFVVDPEGRPVYANPATAAFLGWTAGDPGRISRRDLYEVFEPRDSEGNRIGHDEHPLVVARLRNEPIHARSRIRGRDGVESEIAVTALPLIGQSDRQLGAFGIFWEIGRS